MGSGIRYQTGSKLGRSAMQEEIRDDIPDDARAAVSRWPCVNATVEFQGESSGEDTGRKDRFMEELSGLFEKLQREFDRLALAEKARCGLRGVMVVISLRVDMQKNEVALDKLYKYCMTDLHLFEELLRLLQGRFPEYKLVVPSLQGYDLAKEIGRHLGMPQIECIYLKGDAQEKLLMGKPLQEITFEGILKDTESHYSQRGGVEKKKQEIEPGLEVSMYHQGEDGEEEVLWMEVKIPLAGGG